MRWWIGRGLYASCGWMGDCRKRAVNRGTFFGGYFASYLTELHMYCRGRSEMRWIWQVYIYMYIYIYTYIVGCFGDIRSRSPTPPPKAVASTADTPPFFRSTPRDKLSTPIRLAISPLLTSLCLVGEQETAEGNSSFGLWQPLHKPS
jgi:hypothetical protein